jgi:hypothetical protein
VASEKKVRFRATGLACQETARKIWREKPVGEVAGWADVAARGTERGARWPGGRAAGGRSAAGVRNIENTTSTSADYRNRLVCGMRHGSANGGNPLRAMPWPLGGWPGPLRIRDSGLSMGLNRTAAGRAEVSARSSRLRPLPGARVDARLL